MEKLTMLRNEYRFLGLVFALSGLGLTACGADDDVPGLPGTDDFDVILAPLEPVAKACGIDVECEAGGILEGNASISGVASVDTFFQSIVNFRAKADGVSAGINAQLAAIKGDFGIAANANLETELKAQISANVEGGLKVVAEPARCQADVRASVAANARCEAKAMPPKIEAQCKGSCEVEASADVMCTGSAELRCTATAPSVACMGECKGSCETMLMAAAACSGKCEGSCSGECSAYSDSGKTMCAGQCDGMCMGSCEVELAAEAKCEGTCQGECTVTKPSGGCEGGVRASCKAEANAMVMCEGRCDGEVTPPMVSAKCEASVKAEAKMNVECTPPRLSIDYELKAGVNAEAQAKFVAGIENLKVRLPALLASLENANLVVDAGKGLAAGAGASIGAVAEDIGDIATEGDLKAAFGLKCALGQVGEIPGALKGSTDKLTKSVEGALQVTGAVGLKP
jgi:hypothetical protein